MDNQRLRIGFIATRLLGTDGVSLETNKCVNILQGLGHEFFCFCGESDWPEERVHMVPEAHMRHPEILKIDETLFKDKKRSGDTSRIIHKLKEHLKAGLYRFVQRFDLNLLIVENALSLPMNVPLGIALAEFIGETSMHTIAHHHDFWWERTRYIKSPADDYLRSAFPCTMSSVYHVVINSIAARELAFRTGIGSVLIPNVMDFISSKMVEDVQKILCNNEIAIEWAEKNYQLGRRYYSYQTLEKRLVTLLDHCIGNW